MKGKGITAAGRIDPRVMERITAAAALKVAAAFGMGADAVAAACGDGRGDGLVARSVETHCRPEDR